MCAASPPADDSALLLQMIDNILVETVIDPNQAQDSFVICLYAAWLGLAWLGLRVGQMVMCVNARRAVAAASNLLPLSDQAATHGIVPASAADDHQVGCCRHPWGTRAGAAS